MKIVSSILISQKEAEVNATNSAYTAVGGEMNKGDGKTGDSVHRYW